MNNRRCGILLHISSLPSDFGIGDLGQDAHAFARALAANGLTVWQFLPLNPTGTHLGNSPYSSPSAFAGNPLFISPQSLLKDNYISPADIDAAKTALNRPERSGIFHAASVLPHLFGQHSPPNPSRVDYTSATDFNQAVLDAAYDRHKSRLDHDDAFAKFCRENIYWLHDYARFVSLKKEHGGAAWTNWEHGLQTRQPDALERWDAHARHAMLREKFIQFLFFSQWQALRNTCHDVGVKLVTDIPIYVTHDSADTWSYPHLFDLDANGNPVHVAGVPPDYFSQTGQRWGNPVYNWSAMSADGYFWWKKRLSHAFSMADAARLDHFRGFCGFWEIPANEQTAINGAWRPAPGRYFFKAMRDHFGHLPIIAEDLGIITDDVRETMREFQMPGIHVLQFAFGGEKPSANPDMPHNFISRSVVYTGTHDNATTREWFESATPAERECVSAYLGKPVTPDTAAMSLIRLAMSSVAGIAIIPMQDILNLGTEGRMNLPGTASDNWSFRLTRAQASSTRLEILRDMCLVYGR